MPQVGVQIVSTAMLFGIQDRVLHSLTRVTSRRHDDILLISTAGAVSGGVLSLITCPMELLKCGLQAGLTSAGGAHKHVASPSSSSASSAAAIMSVCRKIWTRHGVQGLYTGLTLTALRCCVGNAAFFGIHEVCWRRATEGGGGHHRYAKDNGLLSLFYGAVSGCAYWLVCVSSLAFGCCSLKGQYLVRSFLFACIYIHYTHPLTHCDGIP